jgi:hypothetical protein
MLTLTVRHHLGDELRGQRVGLANAYRRFTRGEPWKRFLERVGYVGSVRGLEVTHGWANGWHSHLHAAFLVRHPELLAAEMAWLSERWEESVVRELGPGAAPNAAHGLDLRPCYQADYLAKLGLEIASPGRAKAGREGSRTPWEIAADLCAERDPEDTRSEAERELARLNDEHLWRLWCEEMRGARMLTWSRGLREAAGLGEEKTDEEIVDGDGPNDRTVVVVPGEIWDAVRNVRGAPAQLLAVAELEGAGGVEDLLVVLARAGRAQAARAAGALRCVVEAGAP